MSKQFINEVSRMKDLFDYKRGVVISEQNPFNPAAQYGIKGTKIEEYPECVRGFGNPIANQNKTEYSIAGTGEYKGFQFYVNTGDNLNPKGRVRKSDGTMGDYTCFNNRIIIDGNYDTTPVNSAPTTKQATQWIKEPATLDDSNNTLKQKMTGEKVKQLQTGLDIKGRGGKSLATGKFWTLTDAKLKELYPSEYTTQKGVTKTLFDKIVNPTLKASTAPAPTTIQAAGASTAAAPTQLSVRTNPNLQTVQTQLAAKQTPEDIYNTLKSGSLVQGDLGNNNIRIDAKALNDEQRNKLQEYMTSNGYEYRRTKNRDGRLVYTKR